MNIPPPAEIFGKMRIYLPIYLNTEGGPDILITQRMEFFTLVRLLQDPARSWSKQKSSEEGIFSLVRFLEDPGRNRKVHSLSHHRMRWLFLLERKIFWLAFNNDVKVLADTA